MKPISIVILNYNSYEDCRECIADLKQQSVPIRIIVVDNCSAEPDRNKLINLCQQEDCVFVESELNKGYNAGNNIGMRYAVKEGYEYILISNPDMRFPDKEFLSKLVAMIDKDPEIAAIGGYIVGLDGKPQSPMKRDGNWKSSFGWIESIIRPMHYKKTQNNLDNPETSHFCSKLMGSCLMVRSSYIKSIGYFDENVFLYCEEAILSRQVEQSGKKMYYLREAECIHAHKSSEKGDPVKRFQYLKKSRHYFIDKYSGDSWIGKTIAKISASLYVLIFNLIYHLKKSLK